jgi:hypothetical protein
MAIKESVLDSIKVEFRGLLLLLQMSGGRRYKAYFTEILHENDPKRFEKLMVGENFWGGSGSVFDFQADTQDRHVKNLRQLRKIGELIKNAGIRNTRVDSACEIIDAWIAAGLLIEN